MKSILLCGDSWKVIVDYFDKYMHFSCNVYTARWMVNVTYVYMYVPTN